MVHVNDVLDFLVARSAAPSNFGAQLDRLKFGIQIAPDPFRARAEVEDHLLTTAAIIRCIDAFELRQEFCLTTRQRKAADAGYKVLCRLQEKAITPRTPQGHLAINILRAYHERSTHSQERGLVAVYQYLATVAPEAVPTPPKTEPDLLQAFRSNTAKRARNVACEAYADSLLALQRHIQVWNKQK